jgi:hypothetical protein
VVPPGPTCSVEVQVQGQGVSIALVGRHDALQHQQPTIHEGRQLHTTRAARQAAQRHAPVSSMRRDQQELTQTMNCTMIMVMAWSA